MLLGRRGMKAKRICTTRLRLLCFLAYKLFMVFNLVSLNSVL